MESIDSSCVVYVVASYPSVSPYLSYKYVDVAAPKAWMALLMCMLKFFKQHRRNGMINMSWNVLLHCALSFQMRQSYSKFKTYSNIEVPSSVRVHLFQGIILLQAYLFATQVFMLSLKICTFLQWLYKMIIAYRGLLQCDNSVYNVIVFSGCNNVAYY